MYSPTCGISSCYYQTIQISVIATGFYHISSQSIIDTYGYIYQDSFDPFNPSVNLILENDQSCPDEQFKLTVNLQVDIKYILVVTTAFTIFLRVIK